MPHSTLADRYSDATDRMRKVGEPSALIGDLSATDQSALTQRPLGVKENLPHPYIWESDYSHSRSVAARSQIGIATPPTARV